MESGLRMRNVGRRGRVGMACRAGLVGLSVVCAGVGVAMAAPPNRAKVRRVAAVSPWERAVRARAEFEAQGQAQGVGTHTRASYTKTMDGFRAIYHGNPRDEHAAEAVYAVAELLEEQGHEFGDALSLRNAVGQFEFVRTQYPGSGLRVAALLEEGRIEDRDLQDFDLARDKYRELVKQAPRSQAAVEAKAALKGMGKAQAVAVPTSEVATDGRSVARTADPVDAMRPDDAATGEPAVHASGGTQGEVPLEARSARVFGTGVSGGSGVLAEPIAAVDVPVVSGPAVSGPAKAGRAPAMVTGIRHWSTATYTRVAIDLGDEVTYQASRGPRPDRIEFDLHGAKLGPELMGKIFNVTDEGFLKKIHASQASPDVTRVVLDVNEVTEYSAFLLPNPYRLIVDIHGASSHGGGKAQATDAGKPMIPVEAAPASQPVADTVSTAAVPVPADMALPVAGKRGRKGAKDAAPAKAAEVPADGETTLVRALGLKVNRIVIDAGHGGHDSGTIGVGGIEEKDVVLDVALRLGKLLHDRLGAEIVYTRADDTFIPLETRTAIANKAQADLFLSIHANSSPSAGARGVEAYYLNFTSDPGSLEVAARENAVSGQSVHELSELVKKIALKNKISESREFAADVDGALYAGLQKGNDGLKNRGIKRAPFVVLIGANMPSILAEISFVTNPKDAAELRRPEYRERVAESLFSGVARYESGLGGAKAPVPVVRASLQ